MSKIPKICKNLQPQPAKPLEWEPFVELGAVHKILSALELSENTEPCFREVILKLEKLLENLRKDDKKIRNLLANDNSLVKCQQCGVISTKKKKNNPAIYKSLEKNTQRLKTQRFSKGSFEDSSYSKVYEERKKRTTENSGNVKNIEDDRYQQFLNSESTILHNQQLDKQKTFTKKFDKYSERPLIEVSAPIRKASNIPRSNARFAQNTRGPKLCQREVELKQGKKIENESKKVKLEEDLEPKNFTKNVIQDLSNLENENGEGHNEQYKHLAKGDCSSFQKNEDYSFSLDHWTFGEKKYSEKTDLETMKPEINFNNLKTVASAENILQSELEENQTMFNSSKENLIHEWITASLKQSKKLSKEKKCAKKSHSTGIQTFDCPPLDIIQKLRAQIIEAIDRFEDQEKKSLDQKKTDRISNNKCQDDQKIEVQMSFKNPSTVSSGTLAVTDLADHSEFFQKQIDNQKQMSPAITSTISLHETISKITSMHTILLEGNREMDWETFQELVESLHPTQRQLWREICEAVRNEANRVAGRSGASAEVCIEIQSMKKKKKRNEKKVIEEDEIAFEMNMTLKDMENFLEKQLKSCLLEKKKKMQMVEQT